MPAPLQIAVVELAMEELAGGGEGSSLRGRVVEQRQLRQVDFRNSELD